MHKAALQGICAQNALSSDSANALTRVEEMAEEKEGDHALDRPVRVIHLFVYCTTEYLRTICDTGKST